MKVKEAEKLAFAKQKLRKYQVKRAVIVLQKWWRDIMWQRRLQKAKKKKEKKVCMHKNEKKNQIIMNSNCNLHFRKSPKRKSEISKFFIQIIYYEIFLYNVGKNKK